MAIDRLIRYRQRSEIGFLKYSWDLLGLCFFLGCSSMFSLLYWGLWSLVGIIKILLPCVSSDLCWCGFFVFILVFLVLDVLSIFWLRLLLCISRPLLLLWSRFHCRHDPTSLGDSFDVYPYNVVMQPWLEIQKTIHQHYIYKK